MGLIDHGRALGPGDQSTTAPADLRFAGALNLNLFRLVMLRSYVILIAAFVRTRICSLTNAYTEDVLKTFCLQ